MTRWALSAWLLAAPAAAQVTVPCASLPCTFSVTVAAPAQPVPAPVPVPAPTPAPQPVPAPAPTPLSSLPLVRSLAYQGAFRVPLDSGQAPATFAYGGTALAVKGASLLLVGHPYGQMVAEISVPAVRTGPLATLDRAAVVTPFVDAVPKRAAVNPTDPNPVYIGGLLWQGGKLIATAYSYYDGSGTQSATHFVDGAGPFALAAPKAGFVSGYMAPIPAAWQSALGGTALVGHCCLPIIGRTSSGPAVFAFDPAKLGPTAAPATALVYYQPPNTPLGFYGQQPAALGFSGTTEVKGIVFPDGTRSVLFFGRTGTTYCYGQGTTSPSLDGKPNTAAGPNEVWCYDPEAPNDKGTHGYPYRYQVWAYDALELAAVAAGTRKPWDVLPYAIWPLTLPYPAWSTHLNGAAYDAATGRIYVSQAFGESDRPVIHVFTAVP